MHYSFAKKVEGGKLVRLELAVDGARVSRAKITGDFFLHPEDALPAVEKSLEGLPRAAPVPQIQAAIEAALAAENAEFIGATPAALAQAVRECLDQPANPPANSPVKPFA